MQIQSEPRVRKRLPCTLNLEERQHSGLILNLSQRGLFVQTSLPAEPGSVVAIDFRDPALDRPINLQGAVVWRRRVSPRMMGINQSGMGVRLLMASQSYDDMMDSILADLERERGEKGETAGRVREASKSGLRRYVFRMALVGSTRSRRIVVHCDSEDGARIEALTEAGEGWSILELTED